MRPKLRISFFCDSSCAGSFCDSCRDNADNPICDDKEAKIAALTSALKELGVDVSQWQPIETAPKDGTDILIFCDDEYGEMFVGFYEQLEKKWKITSRAAIKNPTHWMPLPTKPKE